MSTNLTAIGQINSTSYQDLVGVMSGLTRNLGESTAAFKHRLELNSISQKSHTYIGTVENINTHLGLDVYNAISISGTGITNIVHNFGQVSITVNNEVFNIPTLIISQDGFWVWQMLSQVVSGLNAIPGVMAVLLSDDGPCVQLANQQNTGWIINEAVTSQTYPLSRGLMYVPGTEVFNITGLDYTITNGTLFLSQPQAGLEISYEYMANPYNLIASQAAVLALTDPDLENYLTSGSSLVYQIQEVVQTLMNASNSYWAE